MLGAMVTDVDERGIEVKYKDGTHRAHRHRHQDLGRRRAGQPARPDPRRSRPAPRSTAPAGSRVNPDLTLPGHPEVFVVGDMIALDNLPGVAQVAIQGAKYAAKEIDGRLRGKAPQPPFKYFDKGSMAIISRFRAVAMVGKLRLTGFIAWLMWLGVHLVYITGFKNRVTAVLHWFVSFLGRGRSERTTTEQQIFARAALARLKRRCRRPGLRPGRVRRRAGDARDHPARGARGQALEEARLTDERRARRRCSPSRCAERHSTSVEPVGRAPASRFSNASRAHLGRMNTPSASTVTPVGVAERSPWRTS